jgi:hypothetical protein
MFSGAIASQFSGKGLVCFSNGPEELGGSGVVQK